eukprot:COSAG02_NODE_12468_length_1541_cov_1.108183_1_plen_230_part_00
MVARAGAVSTPSLALNELLRRATKPRSVLSERRRPRLMPTTTSTGTEASERSAAQEETSGATSSARSTVASAASAASAVAATHSSQASIDTTPPRTRTTRSQQVVVPRVWQECCSIWELVPKGRWLRVEVVNAHLSQLVFCPFLNEHEHMLMSVLMHTTKAATRGGQTGPLDCSVTSPYPKRIKIPPHRSDTNENSNCSHSIDWSSQSFVCITHWCFRSNETPMKISEH